VVGVSLVLGDGAEVRAGGVVCLVGVGGGNVVLGLRFLECLRFRLVLGRGCGWWWWVGLGCVVAVLCGAVCLYGWCFNGRVVLG